MTSATTKARVGLTMGVIATVVGAALVVRSRSTSEAAVPKVGIEVPATAQNQGTGRASNSPMVLADPGDERFVALASRTDAPDFGCGLEVSGNGGRGWVPVNPVPKLPEGAEKCYGPEVAFDGAGRLYYLFVGLAGAGNRPMGVFLTTSADRGRTFEPPIQILGPLRFAVRMAIDPATEPGGRLHLVWLEARSDVGLGGFGAPPNPILSAYSDDGGRTFSAPVEVQDPARPHSVAPALALGPDHAVHVAYYDLGGDAVDYRGLEGPVWPDTWSVVVASSADGGRTFKPGVVVDDGIVPYERVMLIFTMPPPSLVSQGSQLCAAWTDARFGDPDAVASCSTNRGRSWEGLRRLNDDPRGNGTYQTLPRLSMAANGRLDAIFYDRRGDPSNVLTDVSYTFSSDRGHHFAPNVKVTSESFDSTIGQQYANVSANGLVEFGSRIGLLSTPQGALAAWTDSRYARRGARTTGQDIFTAQIALPAARPALWPGVALLLAGVAVVASVVIRMRRRRDDTVDAVVPAKGPVAA